MSSDVAIGGFSIKLNEENQSEDALKKIAKSFGWEWDDNWQWDDIMYGIENYLYSWKPQMDGNGKYGFVYHTYYKYNESYIEQYIKISDMGKALKEFIDKTKIMPREEIQTFAIVYYNGSESPFKF